MAQCLDPHGVGMSHPIGGALLICAGGVRDHVHLYVSLGPRLSLGSLVSALKANSCRWVHETFPHLRLFAWQKGYAAFSVSKRSEHRLISYIRNQEAHHREETSAGELNRLLTPHGVRAPSLPRP